MHLFIYTYIYISPNLDMKVPVECLISLVLSYKIINQILQKNNLNSVIKIKKSHVRNSNNSSN